MSIDKNKIVTQDDVGEPAAVDQVEGRVQAEMKKLEGSAKRDISEGLDNEELGREGEKLIEEGERELAKAEDES